MKQPRVWTVFAVCAIALLGTVILYTVVVAVTFGPDFLQADPPELGMRGLLVSAAVGAAALAVCAVAFARPFSVRRLRLGPSRARSSTVGAIVIGTLAVGSLGDSVVTLLGFDDIGALSELRRTFEGYTSGSELLLALVVVGLVAGTAEELFFRGFVQTRLVERWRMPAGVIVSSVLFGLAHLDPVHSMFAFAMGLWLGFATERAGSIRPAIAAHVINNVVAGAVAASGLSSPDVGPNAIGGAIALVALVALVLSIRHVMRALPPIRTDQVPVLPDDSMPADAAPSALAASAPRAPQRRRPWVAALLAVVCSGLGHAYAGRAYAGAAIQALLLGAMTALLLALRIGVGAVIAAGATMLALWAAQAGLAARAATLAGDAQRGWSSRPLGLVAFFLAATLASEAIRAVIHPVSARTLKMPSGSMTPTIQPGDYFVIVPGATIERGAVVVHDAPPSAPTKDPLVKRIVAVGGDTVEVRDGHLVLNGEPVQREQISGPCTYEATAAPGTWSEQPCVEFVEKLGSHAYRTYCTPFLPCGDVPRTSVPARHVFVLGDHRDHSADSRVFGPIHEEAIQGRASYVLFSMGGSGIRWDRVGAALR